ncbi:hypothetical protein N7520_001668 [Penicillium odoratum]|uniref:uncharacterized protein n=1 Tax=Penicillium odoratum TaxID=1167516 RepID=UPI00254980B1|nr:uncharacterized protein N7520_001668 [Penicillium odoratum]KAJ5778422.1 hypothetical protein N7520_001668 [Penicillium odoratum]
MAVQSVFDIKSCNVAKIAELPWPVKLYILMTSDSSSLKEQEDSEAHNDITQPVWSITHSYFANMGGILYRGAQKETPLTTKNISKNFELYKSLNLTEEDIRDKGKSDLFAKGLAILQISQLVLSLIARAYRGLPFSQLETLTLSFSVCGVATYLSCWYKPQNVEVATQIKEKPPLQAKDFPKFYDNFWNVLMNTEPKGQGDRIANDNIPSESQQNAHAVIPLLALLSAAFGSLHLIAWNFDFPTSIEQLLWRIATILSIAVPILGLLAIPLAQITVKAGDPQQFMGDCSQLLRELLWDDPTRRDAQKAVLKLESIQTEPRETEPREYKDIFDQPSLPDDMLELMERSLEESTRNLLREPLPFLLNLRRLVKGMKGLAPKRIVNNCNTHKFPRRSLLPESLNLIIIYITGLIYSLSRLMIIALALSSLRSMPDEVYVITWTKNIPSIQ